VPIEGFDHVAITVADVDTTVAWYQRVLGAEALHWDLWQAAPHAVAPTPGSADLCFRFDGPVDEILALLEAGAVEVEDGPVPRPAANGERGTSVYFRDPDGNLLELLTLTATSG
jgi:catechol 2,3-dioxygenase-like lactoylglutathione lyase family enzyme